MSVVWGNPEADIFITHRFDCYLKDLRFILVKGFGSLDQYQRCVFVKNTLCNQLNKHIFLTAHEAFDPVEFEQSRFENFNELFNAFNYEVVDLLRCV